MDTTPAPPDPTAERLVMELIRAGLIFHDTLADVIDSVEASGAFPGENSGEVVVAMAAGSVQSELRATGSSPTSSSRGRYLGAASRCAARPVPRDAYYTA
jgi:hypothetical protein